MIHLLILDIFLTNCQHHFFAILDFAKLQSISLLCAINLSILNWSSLNRYISVSMYSLNSIQRTMEFAEYKWGSISLNTNISVLHEHKQVFRVPFKLGICPLCIKGSSKRHSFNHVEFILKRVFTAKKCIIDLSSFLCFQLFKSCSSMRIIIRNYRSFFCHEKHLLAIPNSIYL